MLISFILVTLLSNHYETIMNIKQILKLTFIILQQFVFHPVIEDGFIFWILYFLKYQNGIITGLILVFFLRIISHWHQPILILLNINLNFVVLYLDSYNINFYFKSTLIPTFMAYHLVYNNWVFFLLFIAFRCTISNTALNYILYVITLRINNINFPQY